MLKPWRGHYFCVRASEELRGAAATYRASGLPGDTALADRLEDAARSATAREGVWQQAGYTPEEQKQLAECWWRNELAIARALRPDPK